MCKKREKELKNALKDMVYQFAYLGRKGRLIVMHTGGISALKHAFKILKYSDPMPVRRLKWTKNLNKEL